MADTNIRSEVLSKLDGDTSINYEGKAESVKAFDKTHSKTNLIRIIVLSVIGIALTVLYIVKASSSSVAIIVILLLSFLYGAFAEVIASGKLKKAKYYITDRHIVADLDSSFNVIPLSSIEKYRFEKDVDGHDYLIIGDCKKGMYGLRSLSTVSARFSEDKKCTESVFYAMSDFDKFKKVFEEQLAKAK